MVQRKTTRRRRLTRFPAFQSIDKFTWLALAYGRGPGFTTREEMRDIWLAFRAEIVEQHAQRHPHGPPPWCEREFGDDGDDGDDVLALA